MDRNDCSIAKAGNGIVVRVSGGKKIGMGHVYRTLTIANVLKNEYGFSVAFIINDDDAVRKVLDLYSYRYAVLHQNTCNSDELSDILKHFVHYKSSVCLMDTQDDASDEIEVFNTHHFAVVLLLNKTRARFISAMNVYPLAHFDYMSMDWANYEGKVVGGGEYIPLAEPFLQQRKALQPLSERKYILVTMGGTDPNKLTIRIMDALSLSAPTLRIRVVLGHAFSFKEEVYSRNRHSNDRFEIIENVDNMHELMAGAGLAITAIGITIYELCFLGVPTVLISNYEHDGDDERELEKLGSIVALGFFERVTNEDVLLAIESLWHDTSSRARMSDRALDITDGQGSARICREIVSLQATSGR